MKKFQRLLGIIIILQLSYIDCYGQSQVWQWAKSAGGDDWEFSTSIACDNNGNTYIGGEFGSSTFNIGNFQFIKSSLYGADFFLAKYNAKGDVLWANSFGGSGSDEITSITNDIDGNTFATGVYNSDTLIIGNDTLYQDGSFSIFLVKFDQIGNPVWARCIHGDTEQISESLSVDYNGNIIITGYFASQALFLDSITLSNNVCGSAYSTFLAKYTSNGQIIWAKKSENIGLGLSRTVQTDSENNIYISGDYSSCPSINFDTCVLLNSDFTGIGSSDVFLVKYNPDGDVIWAKSINGGNEDYGKSMIIDNNGNIYQTGISNSPTITLGNLVVTRCTGCDFYLCKYDNNGNVLWVKYYGGDGGERPYNLAYSPLSDEIFMTGYFWGVSGTFLNIGNSILAYSETPQVFLTNLDNSGNGLWSKIIGKKSQYDEVSICINTTSDLYLTGNFDSSTINFGSDTLYNAYTGTSDIFISKLSLLTGLENVYKENDLIFFPNPSYNFFTFSNNIDMSIEIFNSLGILVKSIEMSKDNSIIVNDLPSGLFLVRTVSKKGISTYKLIKE